MSVTPITIEYNAEPTMVRFHASDAFYRLIRGPVGSGKTTGCCVDLMVKAQLQRLSRFGTRRTRFNIARNTYRELEDTTLKTWFDWFPQDYFGNFKWRSMTHEIRFPLTDGTMVECDVMFRALDNPKDIDKLLSLEVTATFFNEIREMPFGLVSAAGDRVGRFPPRREEGCSWRGVIGDTNSMEDDHWYARMEMTRPWPDGWDFFTQPGGLIEVGGKFKENPEAENIHNLEEGYYINRVGGKKKEHVRVYYCNQFGFVSDGKPVFEDYVDAVHCSQEVLEAIPGLTLYVGIDFGLTPAAVFGQRAVNGQWRWIDELTTEHMGAKRFGEELKRKIQLEYKGFDIEFYGDPAGSQESQTDETTPFEILEAVGIPALPAPTNDPIMRRESVIGALNRMIDGKPGFLISPKCKVTRKGLAGGYCLKRIAVAGEDRFKDKPDKNKYSHPVEAGEYMMLGAGEGDTVLSRGSGMTAEEARSMRAKYGRPMR